MRGVFMSERGGNCTAESVGIWYSVFSFMQLRTLFFPTGTSLALVPGNPVLLIELHGNRIRKRLTSDQALALGVVCGVIAKSFGGVICSRSMLG